MTRRRTRLAGALGALAVVALVVAPPAGAAEPERPRLGEAEEYALIADEAITATGSSIEGSVAIAASDQLSGVEPGDVVGETHLADDKAIEVAGITAAVNQQLKSQPCNSDRTGEDQADLRLGESVYCYVENTTLSGVLRLDALGDVDAKFVFQIAAGYDVAEDAQVLLVNGAQACNVFWQVTGPVTIGAGADFAGTIVSDDDVTMLGGSSLNGRIFAPQGAITLTDATITSSACKVTGGQVTTTSTAPPAAPVDTDGDGIADVDEPGDANGNGVPDANEAPGAAPTPTTPGGGGDGTGGGHDPDGTGGAHDPDGTGGSGLPRTGPTLVLTLVALAAVGTGQALLGTTRLVERRRRRWRPRHAAERRRLRR